MHRLKTLLAFFAAVILIMALTPAKASASHGGIFKYFPNRLSPQYKFAELYTDARPCYYRIRFGNLGNVAYAQLRVYNGNCNGTTMRLYAAGSTRSIEVDQSSTIGGRDGCGPYIEVQATSPPGYIGTGMEIRTPYRYLITYISGETIAPLNDPVTYCG